MQSLLSMNTYESSATLALIAENQMLRSQLAACRKDALKTQHKLMTMIKLIGQMAAIPPDQALLSHALDFVMEEIGAQGMALHVWSPQQGNLDLVSHRNLNTSTLHSWRRISITSLEDQVCLPLGDGIQATLSAPIHSEHQLIGLLTACWSYPRCPTSEEQELLHQAAIPFSLLMRSESPMDQIAPDKFVSILAHDLRGPLALISGYAEVLLEGYFGTLTDEQAEQVHTIRASAQRAADLITLVSDAFKVAQGRLALDIQPLDVRQVLHDAIAELVPYLTPRDQTFHIVDGNSPYTVPADQERLRAALSSLLRLAAQQSPAHSTFSLHITPPLNGADMLTLTGRIASSENENGTRSASVESKPPSGLPIPLFIAQTLIKAHGGRLTWSGLNAGQDLLCVELPVASTMLPG